jgi:glutamyl-tRNA synthetase
MLADFDLQRLGRAAARFDNEQLLHWQKEAVAHLSIEEFQRWIAHELPTGLDAAASATFTSAVRHNILFPTDAKRWVEVVFGTLSAASPEAAAAIREAGEAFFAAARDVFARTHDFKQAVREIGQQTSRKGPALYMPLRAALTGETHGPELAPLLPLIPPAEVASRLTQARELART